MRLPPRVTNIILFLGLLGAAGYAYWEHQLRLVANEALIASDRDRADLRKQLWARKQAAATAAASVESDAANARNRSQDGPPDDPMGGRMNGMFNRFNQMMENPEAQRLLAIQQKAGLDARYSQLFKAMHLTPEQLDKFKSLLVEKQNAMIDVLAAARAQGMTGPGNRAELNQMIQTTQAEVDSTIRTTLGDAAFTQYQTYEQTLPQRNTVSQLDARLSYSEQPLSPTQTDQLISILANTAKPTNAAANSAGGNANPGRPNGIFNPNGAPITDAAIAQAQTVLTPTQVSAMTQLQQEQQAQAALRQLMRNQGRGATPAATPPAPPKG